MKTLFIALSLACTPVVSFALPNYDPFADATGSGGTAYAVGNWVSKNDAGTVGTGQKDATGGQWYHAGPATTNSPVIVSGNVLYPGLAGGSGNSVVVGTTNTLDAPAGRYAPPGIDLGSTVLGFRYYSFVLKASDLNGMGAGGGTALWIAGFNNTTATSTANIPTVIGGR